MCPAWVEGPLLLVTAGVHGGAGEERLAPKTGGSWSYSHNMGNHMRFLKSSSFNIQSLETATDGATGGSEFYYPKKFKEIKMVRAVNIQTVIGNAGGYVGLFLGKIISAFCFELLHGSLCNQGYLIFSFSGFALLQLPDFIGNMYQNSNAWFTFQSIKKQ